MPSLGNLFVRIGADTTGLETAERRSGRIFRSISTAGKRSMLALAGAVTGASVAMVALTANSLKNLDAQAKLSRSLNTTVKGLQIIDRAGSLAGVSISGIEQATKDLTRRLSQAAAGTGPAADALDRLNLSVENLQALPLNERIDKINSAIRDFIPAAEQAAVAGQLFGEEGSIAMMRLDSETIRTATRDVERFGIAVSEFDAQQIEATNDALSRMGLVATGLGNQLAARLAPTLQKMADRFADMAQEGGVLDGALDRLVDGFDALVEALATEQVMNAAVVAFESLITLAESGARVMVFFAENTEIAIGTITAITVALLGLSGPFGLIALGAGALVALYTAIKNVEKPTTEFSVAAGEAEAAINLLNESLDGFQSGSPETQRQALGNAQAYKQQAQAALEAASAALAEQRARQSSANALLDQNPLTAGGQSGYAEAIDADTQAMEASLARQEAALAEANGRIKNLVLGITGSDTLSSPTPTGPNGGGGGDGEEEEDSSKDPAGVGSANDVADQFKERLVALQAGMEAENEQLDVWREQAMEDLAKAKEQGLLNEKEYNNRKEAIELHHQNAMLDIKERASQEEINMRKKTQNALIGLLTQFGSKNKALAKAAVALNAAQRVSEIAANTAAASTRALAELGPIAGPPAAARIAAYGKIQAGIAIASAAMNMSGGGGGGGGGGNVSVDSDRGGNNSVQPDQQNNAPQRPNVELVLIGEQGFTRAQIVQIAEALNDAGADGQRLVQIRGRR